VLRYRALLAYSWLAQRLPHRVIYALAAVVAELAYIVNVHGRRVCEDNVRHALGPAATPAQIRRAVRGCFRAASYYYVDLSRTPIMDPERFLKVNLATAGFEHIAAAYAEGRGVIIATIHYGNAEYVAQSMSAHGYHFLALTEPLEPPPLSRLIQRLRSSQGQTFVEVGWTGMKAALRHLKAGGAVCIVCDRDIQHSGEPVPFFGAIARIPSGAIDLARHTGAPVIPAVTRRIGTDRFELIVEPPLELIGTGRPEHDRRENTARLIQRFEPYLREDPSQWFVLEQRIWEGGTPAAAEAAPHTAAGVGDARGR
jgi:lauroyl/myristoyl acyltransferase